MPIGAESQNAGGGEQDSCQLPSGWRSGWCRRMTRFACRRRFVYSFHALSPIGCHT
jgi:hypothetical protein